MFLLFTLLPPRQKVHNLTFEYERTYREIRGIPDQGIG